MGAPREPSAQDDARRARRAARRARRRRNRRLALVAALAAVAAAVIAALRLGGGAGGGSASETVHGSPAAPVVVAPGRTRSGAAGGASERGERAAVQRTLQAGVPLYRAGTTGREVALTFDDGPGPFTAQTLRALRHYGMGATFFLVGRNLATWPGMPAAEAADGAVGDHTWTHPLLTRLGAAGVLQELGRTQRAVARAGRRPVILFRPPYGAHNATVDATARRLGMLEVLWSIDSRDSEGANWRQMLATIEGSMRPGDIVLFHENRGQTQKVINRLLPWMRRHDLRSVGVPRLLADDPASGGMLRAIASGRSVAGGG